MALLGVAQGSLMMFEMCDITSEFWVEMVYPLIGRKRYLEKFVQTVYYSNWRHMDVYN